MLRDCLFRENKLNKSLNDENVRRFVRHCFIGKIFPEAIPSLIRVLKNGKGEIKGYAAVALGRAGPAAKDAVPLLIKVLKDEKNKDVRWNVVYAVGMIGDKSSLETLYYVAKQDSNKDVRNAAKEAIKKINARSRSGSKKTKRFF